MDPNATQPPVQPLVEQPPLNQPVLPSKRISKRLIIASVLILVIILLIAVTIILLNNSKKSINNLPPVINLTPTIVVLSPTPIVSIVPQPKISEIVDLKIKIVSEIKNTDISLTYENSVIPSENCADCISSTIIIAEQGANKKTLNFSCGGFTGECTNKLESFGYDITLVEQIDPQTIRVQITK